jgi:arginase
MHVAIIQVPYHLGRPHTGVGRGPRRIVLGGLDQALTGPGVETSASSAERIDMEGEELEMVARVSARTATEVQGAVAASRFPVILSGDCNAAIGVLGGLAMAGCNTPGVLWFDAHGDLNTPETSTTGFLDGMALASATGRCHGALRAAARLETPVAESRVVLLAVRDLDPAEEEYLSRAPMRAVRADAIRHGGAASVTPVLEALHAQTADLYVHLDLDALDPADAPAAGYRVPNGISADTLAAVLRSAASRFRVRALTVTNYDPSLDDDDRTLGVVMRMVHVVVRAVAGSIRDQRAGTREWGR